MTLLDKLKRLQRRSATARALGITGAYEPEIIDTIIEALEEMYQNLQQYEAEKIQQELEVITGGKGNK